MKEGFPPPLVHPARGVEESFTPACQIAAMPHTATHAEAVHAAIESMGGTVLVARALVEGGRRVDLEGLDRDATALCAAVLALGVEEARMLRPALEALLRQVNDLAAQVALG